MKRHLKAFSLIELMVVLLVTLIISGVALQVFTTVNSVNEQAMESTRIQTRHSVGIAQLSRLIRLDGYGAWAYEALTGNVFENLLLSPSGVDGSSELTIYSIDQANIEDMIGEPDPANPGDYLTPEISNMVPRSYAFYLEQLGESHTLYIEDPDGNKDPLLDGVQSFIVEVRSDVNGDGTFYMDNGEIQPDEDWVDSFGLDPIPPTEPALLVRVTITLESSRKADRIAEETELQTQSFTVLLRNRRNFKEELYRPSEG